MNHTIIALGIPLRFRSSWKCSSLRVFGAANWPLALDLAQAARESALPELRWAALNYYWETDVPTLSSELENFLGDEDPEIAALAKVCIETLASDSS